MMRYGLMLLAYFDDCKLKKCAYAAVDFSIHKKPFCSKKYVQYAL